MHVAVDPIAEWNRKLLYFDNVTMKFIVNNRIDALKTDTNVYFFCHNNLSNCVLSLVDASHKNKFMCLFVY